VLVRYRLPRSHPRALGAQIVVSPREKKRFYPPTGGTYWRKNSGGKGIPKRAAILGTSGVVRIPIPRGPGPYEVIASSVGKRGESSKVVKRLRR